VKRHPFDALSFVFGALFVVAAALLGSDRLGVSDLGGTNAGPVVVIALGAILVVAAVVSARSERAAVAHAPAGSEGQTAEENGPEGEILDETAEELAADETTERN
jgi:hypothetical protein